ncbi:MAG: primosomal protein N', partial [Acidobacteriia bacterium]|nr:primosomal protein N' [Terriglobia bacterium]
RAGQRVVVPLGTRRATGIVIEPVAQAAPGFKVREILGAVDPEPLLSPELLTLGLWMAEYYVAPVGEVFRAMLPLRATTRRVRFISLTDRGREQLQHLESGLLEEIRGGDEAKFLRYLADQEGQSAGTAFESIQRRFTGVSTGLITRAVAEGWVAISELERDRGARKVFAVRLAGPLPEHLPRLSPVARRILEALEQRGEVVDHRELLKAARGGLSHLKKLSEAGLLELGEPRNYPEHSISEKPTGLEVTPSQASVLSELTTLLDTRRFNAALLYGVTASGKTEIYLRLIARCLEQGRTALMLVPEISLTPSVQSEFYARFGSQVAVLHSGLSETERHESWWRARRSEAKVVLGTRSAVFAPLTDLGVVIVDEEHDASYKQEETPRYHGRDGAVVRARLAQALVVLGSATPSLESYWNAREGKYHLLKLEERIAGRSLASVEIVDMRQEFRETHTQVPISRRLKGEIDAQLQSGAQTMILLNRRGYSWFLLCRSCGETNRCVNCSISLTYHRREHKLICHYCGYTATVPSHCTTCGSEYLHYVGEGTEKLEAKIAETFPLVDDDPELQRLAGQDLPEALDQLQRLLVLVHDLLPLEPGEPLEPHLQDRLGLDLREPEAELQGFLSLRRRLRPADRLDHLVQVVDGQLEPLEDVGPLLRLPQVELGPPDHHLPAEVHEVPEHVLEGQDLRPVVDDGEADDAESHLELGELVEVV